ncbi:SusC/RagA family TonB-linked outer membrane protein [Flammeovirga kamogawensis]|uniref:TonB-dependent receptor n=1 Tax=Flammeovirga kamogawensis TaxID=373891 RepID=A0ABX8GYC8_9BACT|nr:TonB-dependent receptor [Flammeovirga kamogawensis]MBB6459050.1 TonB-linked SusC/RagA family outer membrane protein [Flammeovirga kamogawensis]QWG08620.1 TonB-dependent receptor [Flammeovirga kamogawensis]
MALNVWAQDQKITGTVTSNVGEPLIGVTVLIKGTSIGSTTDFDGNYSLSAKPEDVLVISYIGFFSQEITVGNKSIINATLEEDAEQLEEVVVVGYGTQKKSEVSSAISSADGDELRKMATSDVATSLQGRVSGVQVSQSGTAPGQSPNINIRGISTLNGNTPLYVVDGAIVEDISFLSPKDIAEIHVLKDAASSAIYGSRGSNGVIIVTTIKGTEGTMRVSVDASAGVQSVARTPLIANAEEYKRAMGMIGSTTTLGSADTNWFNEVQNDAAPIQDYNINITGGSEKIRYNISGNYYSQEGVLKGYDYERFTGRFGLDVQLSDKVTIGQTFSITPSKTIHGAGSIPFDAVRLRPTDTVYKPIDEQQGLNQYSIYAPSSNDVPNLAGRVARNDYNEIQNKIFSNTYLNYEIAEGLAFKTQLGYYYSTWQANSFSPEYSIGPNDFNEITKAQRDQNIQSNYVWNNTLTYQKVFGKHSVSGMIGMAMERLNHQTAGASGLNVPSNNPNLRYPEAAQDGFRGWGTNDINSLASGFARLSYSYDERYFMTANFRIDGSSRFPDENKWASFPSISLGWNASNEAFLENADWLSQLRLRGSWGQVGNQAIPDNTAYLTTLTNYDYVYGVDGNRAPGLAPAIIGNPNLKWETVEDIDIGIDVGIMNDKFTFTFDWFDRTTKDMLMQKNVPPHLGFPGHPGLIYANVGSMNTRGWDANISYNLNKTDWTFGASLNLSQARSQVVELSKEGESLWGGSSQRVNYMTRTTVGSTVAGFYGFVHDGVFQNQKEINSHATNEGKLIQPNAAVGDIRFKDLNGDGVISDEDRQYIGNPEPDVVFGLTLNGTYKGFDLSMTFQGTYGNDIINGMAPYTYSGDLGNTNIQQGVADRSWSGEGSTNFYPRLDGASQTANFHRFSSLYIQDGSFLRLQNIQVGYTFNKIKNVEQLRVFASAQNLFTITGYDGMDPDVNGSSNGLLDRGIDWGAYPTPRTIMMGVNFNF